MHLFPRSFKSFINWYDVFKPLARRIIDQFRSELAEQLKLDESIPQVVSKIVIQSRLKAPSSAFKKMLNGAKQRSQLFDILGVRIIVSDRNTTSTSNIDTNEEVLSTDTMWEGEEHFSIMRIYNITGNLSNWREDRGRFKDYVSHTTPPLLMSINQSISPRISRMLSQVRYPKASGYQSIHASLQHQESGIFMEIQIRSDLMHWNAEFGKASHSNYKALLLPSQTGDR